MKKEIDLTKAHRIVNLKVVGEDKETGARIKKIQTSAGNFLSRTVAYNQSFEKIEERINALNSKNLNGPPMKLESFAYDRRFKPRNKFLYIKLLTESRLKGVPHWGTHIYQEEIEYIKNKIYSPNKISVLHTQISTEDWKIFDENDQTTIVNVQKEANAPYITVPISPFQTYGEAQKIILESTDNLKQHQRLNILLDPHMGTEEAQKTANFAFNEKRCLFLSVVGKTPSDTHNSILYKFLGKNTPEEKMLVAVDVENKFGGFSLPTHLAFRSYNFDLTCHKVLLKHTRRSTDTMNTKHTSSMAIYVDQVAAMLNEIEQRKYSQRSITDQIFDMFSMKDRLEAYDLLRAYNFVALNRTAQIEADHILAKKHVEYIKDRLHLEAFFNQEGLLSTESI